MKERAILLILLFSVFLQAQICWEESGVPVYNSENLNWQEGAIALSDGNYLIVWSDTDAGWQQMKAMKINAEGEYVWQQPVLLKQNHSFAPSEFRLLETSDGVCIAWFEYLSELIVNCQKIDLNGYRLWGDNGVSIYTGEQYTSIWNLWLQPGSDDGIFVVWHIFNWPQEVTGVYLNSQGEVGEGWSQNGNVLLSCNYEFGADVHSDLQNGIVITYNDYNNIKFQRVNSAGELLWGENGIDYNFSYTYTWAQFFVNNPAEFYLYCRNGNTIYRNILNEEGEILFEQPQFVYSLPVTPDYFKYTLSSDSSLFIVWRQGSSLYAQKILADSTEVWGEQGCLIMENIPEVNFFYLYLDLAGGFILLLHDYNSYDNGFWLQHVNEEGNTVLGSEGYPVAFEDDGYYNEKICFLNEEVSALFWRERAEEEDRIKTQFISSDTGIMLEEGGRSLVTYPSILLYNAVFRSSEDYSALIWHSSNTSPRKLYTQIIENEEGSQLFPDNPLKISGDDELNYSLEAVAFDDNQNLLYVAFNLNSADNSYQNCGVQAIDLDGNKIFAEDGLLLHLPNEGEYFDFPRFRKTADGMLLLYAEPDSQFPEGSAWKLQKINEQGFVWQQPVTICGATSGYASVHWKGNFLVWEYGYNLRIIKFDDNGNIDPDWNNDYLNQVSLSHVFETAAVTDQNDNLYLFWVSDDYDEESLFGQKINASAEFCWGDEGRNYYVNDGLILNIFPAADFFYFIDFTGSPSAYYLYKYDYEGNTLWTEPVVMGWYNSDDFLSASFWNNNVLFYYHPAMADVDIMLKAYNPDGDLLPPTSPDGLTICEENGSQYIYDSQITSDDYNYIAWKDYRNGVPDYNQPGVFAQKISLSSLLSDENQITPSLHVNNYPNPFYDETLFRYSDGCSRRNHFLKIFNIKGQLIKTIIMRNGTATWNGSDENGNKVSSAVYLYQIQSEEGKAAGKLLYLNR